ADLTVPPEQLLLFHRAFQNGAADFVNGNRLIYPMEGGAMRFLNWIGNQLFARMLSFVLDCQLGDTLCGTKLFLRSDYARFLRWRDRFGDFDPFGDFELLFPAAELGLGIVDIPVRYGARSYGATSIRRFTHGIRLLRMVGWGLWKIRMGSAAA
ncbi:MAG: glycosyl transferase, partial [Bdellovibrionota bacterium]